MLVTLKIIIPIFLLLVFMYIRAFQKNEAMGRHDPGFLKRFNIYFNSHVSETSDTNILPEMKYPRFQVSTDKLFQLTEIAVKNLGWITVSVDNKSKEIKAIVQSQLFKFKDDIKLRIEKDDKSPSRLYAYSSSRIGIGDMGANQKHIMDLVAEINKLI